MIEYQQLNPEDRIGFEENIKNFVHHLDLQINLLQCQLDNIEIESRSSLQSEIDRLRVRKEGFVSRASLTHSTTDEQWFLVYHELNKELSREARQLGREVKSIKKGFSYELQEVTS